MARAIRPFAVQAACCLLVATTLVGCDERRDEARAATLGSAESARKVPAAASVLPKASGSQPKASVDPDLETEPGTLKEQRALILRRLKRSLSLKPEAVAKIQAIFDNSEVLGQGNPRITKHPMTKSQCLELQARTKPVPASPQCKTPNMVAVYPAGGSAQEAKLCIDQFEFPNLPCEYPVTWVRASEAAALCEALDKRLCDAHEWEGACAGALEPLEKAYPYQRLSKLYDDPAQRRERRLQLEYWYNRDREIVWAYGKTRDPKKCGLGPHKDERCVVVDYGTCGTNTYPAGSFPECVSPFGVYDQHGNVAEHMNLPVFPDELASTSKKLGSTEMKASWFGFGNVQVHPDDCRWRAKNWHGSRVRDPMSHRNYHLGFRCCKDID